MNYNFNVEKATNDCIKWIQNWFERNGKGCNAIVGISGGKDSSIVAALCVEALGRDRVIGVVMPNGIQNDLEDTYLLIERLQIKDYYIDIKKILDTAYGSLSNCNFPISKQTMINLPPRIRMSLLYAIAQSNNGRIIGTGNLSENYVGYFTRYGDGASDCEPLGKLTVQEVKAIGHYLDLPFYLVEKIPTDGLCGITDEQNLGITYKTLDHYIRTNKCANVDDKNRIMELHQKNLFKQTNLPMYEPDIETLYSEVYYG